MGRATLVTLGGLRSPGAAAAPASRASVLGSPPAVADGTLFLAAVVAVGIGSGCSAEPGARAMLGGDQSPRSSPTGSSAWCGRGGVPGPGDARRALGQAPGWPPSIDIPTLQALALWASVLIVALSLLADLAIVALDPKVRAGGAPG